MSLLLRTLKETVVKDCKGIIFRCYISSYLSQHNSIEIRKSLRILKTKSCKGCECCGWIMEFLQEFILDEPNLDYLIGLENGADTTGGSIVTGQNMADAQSFSLTLEAMEGDPAFFVQASVIPALASATQINPNA